MSNTCCAQLIFFFHLKMLGELLKTGGILKMQSALKQLEKGCFDYKNFYLTSPYAISYLQNKALIIRLFKIHEVLMCIITSVLIIVAQIF